jgi:hypothetical protein
MRALVLLVLPTMLASCRPGCDGKMEPGRTGDRETRVFITCNEAGYAVRNEGDVPRYVMVDAACVLNSAQVDVGPGGELPDMTVYSSTGRSPMPLAVTIEPGAEVRRELDVTTMGHCMDQTMAPPGQHEREPVSLISEGPADAIRMRLDIHEVGSTAPPRRMDIACKW